MNQVRIKESPLDLWQNLVTENPMTIEVKRFRRRFLSMNSSSAIANAVLALAMVAYASLITVVAGFRGDIPPMVMIIAQTAIFCFVGPVMLHSAIAGERERRSWDLLLVAPISKAQIVMGKFMGGLAALGVGAALMLLPTLITAASYPSVRFANLVVAELISLSFSVFVCALTLFFSARVRRPFMALAATLGGLLVALLFLPLLIGVSTSYDSFTGDFAFFLHPFWAIAQIGDGTNAFRDGAERYWYGIPHVVVYVGLTLTLLVWTEKTLHFPENDVRFIPKGAPDA